MLTLRNRPMVYSVETPNADSEQPSRICMRMLELDQSTTVLEAGFHR